LAIAKGNLPSLRSRRFELSFRQAHRLFVKLNRPVVRGVPDRAGLFLSTDCFQIVVYYLFGGRQLFCPGLREDRLMQGSEKTEGQ